MIVGSKGLVTFSILTTVSLMYFYTYIQPEDSNTDDGADNEFTLLDKHWQVRTVKHKNRFFIGRIKRVFLLLLYKINLPYRLI